MANIIISDSIEATRVLEQLRSLDRPLTTEEQALGRKAALVMIRYSKECAAESEKSLRDTMMHYYTECGYTADEAREAIRLDALERRERDGYGVSKRCKFDQAQRGFWIN